MQIGEPVAVGLIGAVKTEAPPPVPKFRMHLDADRDGTVDDNWRGLGTWAWGRGKRGAICLCNADDDDARRSQDHKDNKVNGGNDKDEIAPLDIRKYGKPAAPGSWKGFLSVSSEDAKRVRIFDSRSGGSEIIGPAAGDTYTFPDLSFTKKEFGMEARFFAGEVGARTPAPISANWDGSVSLTFKIEDSGTEIYKQVGQVRVAPWVMMHHLDKPEKVYVVDRGADRVDASGLRMGNSGFRSELAAAVGGVPIVEKASWDVWMQDCMEIGFTGSSKVTFPVAVPARRDRDLGTYPETLLTADYGYQRTVPMPPDPDDAIDGVSTFDSNGNLEVTPPCTVAGKKYALGRIYYGGVARALPEDFETDVRIFLEAQLVQSPFSIDTSWLAVGHVDEVVSFVKGNGAQGFKMLIASWNKARKILENRRKKHPTTKMLVGREMPRASLRTGRFLSYDNVEVTVDGFLTTGIPSLGSRGTGLIAFNDRVQGKIDTITASFKAAIGVKDKDIIQVPTIYFPSDGDPSLADALTGGMVNTLVLNQTCIMAKAFGPQTAAGDLFEIHVSKALKKAGAQAKFVDDWYPYHVQLGEVHCGTNTLRKPSLKKWWEVKP